MAFYDFKNGSLDDAIASNDLINVNGVSNGIGRKGVTNCAMEFDRNQNQYLMMSNPEFLNNLNDYSVSLWYYRKFENTGEFMSLISRDTVGRCPDKEGQWSLGIYDGGRPVFAKLNSTWVGENSNFDSNRWIHIVACYRASDSTHTLYIDGEFSSETKGVANCGSEVNSLDIGDLFIGREFGGVIDDILILNKYLSAEEVKSLYEIDDCCD